MYFALVLPTLFLCAVGLSDLCYAVANTWKEWFLKCLMVIVQLVLVLLVICIAYNSWHISHCHHVEDDWCSALVIDHYFTAQLELLGVALNMIFLYSNFCDIIDRKSHHIRSSVLVLSVVLYLAFAVANLFNYGLFYFYKTECFEASPQPEFIGSIGLLWSVAILYLFGICFLCCLISEESETAERMNSTDRILMLVIVLYLFTLVCDLASQLHSAVAKAPKTLLVDTMISIDWYHVGLFLPVSIVPLAMIVCVRHIRHRFSLQYVDYLPLKEQQRELNDLNKLNY